MLLRFCDHCSQYTIETVCSKCQQKSRSAHPARFSPDDKFSKYRVMLKKRHNVLPTQLPADPY